MSNPTVSRGCGEWPNCDTASLHEMRTEEKLSMTFYRITPQAVEVTILSSLEAVFGWLRMYQSLCAGAPGESRAE